MFYKKPPHSYLINSDIFMCANFNIEMYPSNQTHLPTPVKTCDNVLKNKVGALKWIKTKLITGLNK